MPASVSILIIPAHAAAYVPECSCVSGCPEPLTYALHRSRFRIQQTQSADSVPHVVLSGTGV